jgi:hypothetical protein
MRGNVNHERRKLVDRNRYCEWDGVAYYQEDLKGVTYDGRYKTPWRAKIRHNKKCYHLGYFASPAEAIAAYQTALKKIIAGEWEAS